jgi:hypothetical protein
LQAQSSEFKPSPVKNNNKNPKTFPLQWQQKWKSNVKRPEFIWKLQVLIPEGLAFHQAFFTTS